MRRGIMKGEEMGASDRMNERESGVRGKVELEGLTWERSKHSSGHRSS